MDIPLLRHLQDGLNLNKTADDDNEKTE